jgi:hypothetical protein
MPPLTFLNSIFLAGLAAAALPILIHLFSKRRAKEVRFPSLEFLQEVSRKKVRRLQLRQILLLVLRVLIIGLFALAMGRPALQTTGGSFGRGSSTTAIVLDNSFSLAARDPSRTELPGGVGTSGLSASGPEAGTVFETAKRRALEVVSMMREGDRGLLALASTPVRFPYQTSVTDLGLLRSEIERSTVEATRADLPHAVERALALLAASKTLNRELYVISDFQRGDVEAWQALIARGTSDSATAGRSGGIARATAEGIRIYLVPVRSLPVANTAIERLRIDAVGAGGDAGARLVVTVVNNSDEEAQEMVLRALAEGNEPEALGEAYLTVPPFGRGEATVLLRHLPASGAIRATLTPDPLPWDNQSYLVTEQPGVRRILLISGNSDPSADPAAAYVRLALDPAGNHEFFDVETLSAEDARLGSGIRADAVVMLDVGRLPDAALGQLERYRADGGGILIVLGERIDPRMYNTAIFPKLAAVELLGLQGDPDRPELYRSLRVAATGHPIFEGFPAGAGGNLTAARFQRLLEAKLGDGARSLAEFSGGMPALIEDRGTLVFTSSLDGKWNDLPTSGAFLPLLHRMMQYLIAQGGERDHILAGSAIETVIEPDRLGGQDAIFIGPQGTRLPAERSEREGKVHLASPPARLPGIYQLTRADGARLGLYAANLDTRESDLRLAPEAWLPALFDPAATVLKPEGEITRATVEGRYGRELWPILLAIVLGLLVAESLLGRGKILP